MKRSTILGVTNESSVHPESVKDKILELKHNAEKTVLEFADDFLEVDCPACASTNHEFAFTQNQYNYHKCNACFSLFVAKRPSNKHLSLYYKSAYAAFVKSEEYLELTKGHRLDQASKRSDQIAINQHSVKNGSGDVLLFASKNETLCECVRNYENIKISNMPPFWEKDAGHDDSGEMYDVIAAFDIFERMQNPAEELTKLSSLLKVGGRILIALRSGSGFDVLTLWEHIKLSPVEHLNLFSVEGLKSIMDQNGLEAIEMSTPGVLDVQFVEKEQKENSIKLNRFVDYLLANRDEFTKNELQQFLQKGLLSSHLFVVGVKR